MYSLEVYMTVPVLTFFNNKGGVGKTSLVYHVAWMLSEMRKRVVVVDLDPQTNLTTAFLDENRLAEIWLHDCKEKPNTIYRAVRPLTRVGDLLNPKTESINHNLWLIPGDVALSEFEEPLAECWIKTMGSGDELYRSFRIVTAFWQVAQKVAEFQNADLIIADIGPNLGALNRSVLVASDYIIIPLAADIYSLQGLTNLGPTLTRWKQDWKKRVENWQNPSFDIPNGNMRPIGYICQQHAVRNNKPVQAYDKWLNKIPDEYRNSILRSKDQPTHLKPDKDPLCLATIKHYRSLVPMAQEQRKPIFHLTTADGAIGSHYNAVQAAYADFEKLTKKILKKIQFS